MEVPKLATGQLWYIQIGTSLLCILSFQLFFLAILLNLPIIPKIITGICAKTCILVRVFIQMTAILELCTGS